MARIRSVHPGLFTDDKFMALSPCAALLLVGIWTECDDQGIFQWRPLTLKARILPVASEDVSALLKELVENGFIEGFEDSGTEYGAVRNFRKFQRPQKPTNIYPLPERYRKYVGLEPTATVPLQEPYDTPTIKSPQMEEGEKEIVGEKKKRKKEPVADAPEFLGFWRLFLSVGRPGDSRKAASKAFSKALSEGVAPSAIMGGVNRYVARLRHESAEKRYTPMAAKWLNGAMWENEPGPAKPAPGTAIAYLHQSSPWNG